MAVSLLASPCGLLHDVEDQSLGLSGAKPYTIAVSRLSVLHLYTCPLVSTAFGLRLCVPYVYIIALQLYILTIHELQFYVKVKSYDLFNNPSLGGLHGSLNYRLRACI